MDTKKLTELRRRGLTGLTAAGEECVRVSLQNRTPLRGKTLPERRELLEGWVNAVQRDLEPLGGAVIAGSLSLAGQTIEAELPVSAFDVVEAKASAAGQRLDLVVPHDAVGARGQ